VNQIAKIFYCLHYAGTKAQQLKVDVQAVQNGSIQDKISKNITGNDFLCNIAV
jgi:hypothetical protein